MQSTLSIHHNVLKFTYSKSLCSAKMQFHEGSSGSQSMQGWHVAKLSFVGGRGRGCHFVS